MVLSWGTFLWYFLKVIYKYYAANKEPFATSWIERRRPLQELYYRWICLFHSSEFRYSFSVNYLQFVSIINIFYILYYSFELCRNCYVLAKRHAYIIRFTLLMLQKRCDFFNKRKNLPKFTNTWFLKEKENPNYLANWSLFSQSLFILFNRYIASGAILPGDLSEWAGACASEAPDNISNSGLCGRDHRHRWSEQALQGCGYRTAAIRALPHEHAPTSRKQGARSFYE